MELRNIEAERVRLGMAQDELCEKVGISVKTLNNYTRGRTQVPSDVLIQLCRTFHCSADYLLGLKKER